MKIKITVQEKIAELESRIVTLEDQVKKLTNATVSTKLASDSIFGDSWKQMWKSFHEVMAKL